MVNPIRFNRTAPTSGSREEHKTGREIGQLARTDSASLLLGLRLLSNPAPCSGCRPWRPSSRLAFRGHNVAAWQKLTTPLENLPCNQLVLGKPIEHQDLFLPIRFFVFFLN